jgi:hypothetical protein
MQSLGSPESDAPSGGGSVGGGGVGSTISLQIANPTRNKTTFPSQRTQSHTRNTSGEERLSDRDRRGEKLEAGTWKGEGVDVEAEEPRAGDRLQNHLFGFKMGEDLWEFPSEATLEHLRPSSGER